MNLDEAVELLRVVSVIPIRDSANHPEIRILHEIGAGYTLHIKAASVSADTRNHLNRITESRELGIRESKHYIIIYSHR
jgi:hypothetical protein